MHMKFKITKILNSRQLRKARFGMYCGVLFVLCTFGSKYFIGEVNSNEELKWNGDTFKSVSQENFDRGRIVYYSKNIEVCNR